ncbi:MAG: hypothetical protein ACFFAI_16800 [Promethearchaeota archaeon]
MSEMVCRLCKYYKTEEYICDLDNKHKDPEYRCENFKPINIKLISKGGGFALGILGGTISIILGLLLLVLFPEFEIFGRLFITIFQLITILGGIVTIIGTFIFLLIETSNTAKLSWIIVLIGAILGGGNIISIFAAVQIKKNVPSNN